MLSSIRIPSLVDSSACLVVLHGLGDSVEGWRWLPDALRLPWLNYVLVNAPDDYYGGYSWYDFGGDSGPGIERSRRELTALMEEQRRMGTPPDQLGILGFSQGCLMTLETGLRYPERLAALVGISGYVWNLGALLREAPPTARLQSVLVTHGRRDAVVPSAPVHAQILELQQGGFNMEWHEFDKAHTVAGEPELALIREFLRRGYGR